MIPLTECKDRHLYKIFARNFTLGVFNAEVNGFIGIREKFGDKFLDTEYHWDTGPPCGTVKPEVDLGLVPDNLIINEGFSKEPEEAGGWRTFCKNEELFSFLKEKEDIVRILSYSGIKNEN